MNQYIKYIGILMLGTISVSAHAYTSCNGGTEVIANTTATDSRCGNSTTPCNGRTFCLSDRAMPWWSAVLWCRKNGGRLVSIDSACPNWEAGRQCINLCNVSGTVWIDKINGNQSYNCGSYCTCGTSDRTGKLPALCE